jgi:phosphoesterase RecJ-like protein
MNEILKKIDEAKHIVVIAHINPDADSLGSASAFYTHLLRLHKKVSFYCATENIDRKYLCIPWCDKIRSSFPSSADLAFSFDCASLSRLGVEPSCTLINVDHHSSNTMFGEIALVDARCISTTKVLYDFFQQNSILLNSKMATGLYAGLLDDSDGFLNERVDGTTFAFAKELIECGAEYKLCNKFILKHRTLASLRLKAIMFANMILLKNAKVALFYVSNKDMVSSGAKDWDCEAALEESLYLPSVEVAVLLKQNSDLSIKGSLRSHYAVNVLKIALEFGGGGHAQRAGFQVSNEVCLDLIKEKILNLLEKEL